MNHPAKRRTRLAVVLALAAFVVMSIAAPASAAPLPTKRVVNDPFQPGKAYDILRVTLKAQPADGDWAKVKVLHSREVQVGDSIDFWFNLDDDKNPDVHVVGDSFSEFSVFKTDSFLEDGKNISKRDCFRLRMSGQLSVVRFEPDCIGKSTRFNVSIRSSRSDQPKGNDWVRQPGKYTKKVLSHA